MSERLPAASVAGERYEGFRHVGDEAVFDGRIWRLVTGTFESPDGQRFTRDIVRSPGAVGVVPIVGEGHDPVVVLIEQYRPALGRTIIEVPAGMRDVEGEAPELTAQRELGEEVGLAASHLHLLTEMVPSPGMSDATTLIYLAEGCIPVERTPIGPEEQHAVLRSMPLSEAVAGVDAGRITDAKTVAGLLLAERRRRSS